MGLVPLRTKVQLGKILKQKRLKHLTVYWHSSVTFWQFMELCTTDVHLLRPVTGNSVVQPTRQREDERDFPLQQLKLATSLTPGYTKSTWTFRWQMFIKINILVTHFGILVTLVWWPKLNISAKQKALVQSHYSASWWRELPTGGKATC